MTSLKVGDSFESKDAASKALTDYAVRESFEFYVNKSDKVRFIAVCRQEQCSFRARFMVLDGQTDWRLTVFNGEHSCLRVGDAGHPGLSSKRIAEANLARFIDTPGLRPCDLAKDVASDGVKASYQACWRAKKRALSLLYGDEAESFAKLPDYAVRVTKANPGSVVELCAEEGRFKRMFMAYAAALHGFRSCRPVITLGTTRLESRYAHTLLTAGALDGQGGDFLLGFAVVEDENADNWDWFLSYLRRSLDSGAPLARITFISDRQEGVVDGVARVFPAMHHAMCVRHLAESVRTKAAGCKLVPLIWAAARAPNARKFDSAMNAMRRCNPQIGDYLTGAADKRFWANAFFSGKRYGHLTSSIGELTGDWVLRENNMPIYAMLEEIRRQLARLFYNRRSEASTWTPGLVPHVQASIREAESQVGRIKVWPVADGEFEIVPMLRAADADAAFIVYLNEQRCTCGAWQELRIPCAHAIAAILHLGRSVDEYVGDFYSAESYRETYSGVIHAVPQALPVYVRPGLQVSEGVVGDDTSSHDGNDGDSLATLDPPSDPQLLEPPIVRRPPGRPKKRPILSEDAPVRPRILICSRCKAPGHNKRTCQVPLTE